MKHMIAATSFIYTAGQTFWILIVEYVTVKQIKYI